jgi:hypothetical protein
MKKKNVMQKILNISTSLHMDFQCMQTHENFIGLAYQGNHIVFRFIIAYCSLRDFDP